MTPTAPAASSALAPLVDVLLATPLDTLTTAQLQTELATVTPQVGRLLGWLSAAAGQLDHRTAGMVTDDTGQARKVSGWLADLQHTTPSHTGDAAAHRPAAAVDAAGLRRRPRRRPHPAASHRPHQAGRQDRPGRAHRVAAEPHRRRRHHGPHPAGEVGQPPDRHPLRTRLRSRAGTGARQAVPHPPTRRRRQPARPVPAGRRGRRNAPDRPGTAGPTQPGPRHPHRRATPRRRPHRTRRTGPAARRARRRRRPATRS